MKAYDITNLTTGLKSSDSVQYRNKIYNCVNGSAGYGYWKHMGLHTILVICPMRIVGYKQVIIRFTN